MKYTLRPYQEAAVKAGMDFFNSPLRENGIIVAPTGCHEKGYRIMMYDGTTKPVEDIVVGDVLMGNNCTPRHVLELHRGTDTMYRVSPIKGEPFVVNGGHILHLYKTCEGSSANESVSYTEISVNDYVMTNKTFKHTHKLHRAVCLDYPNCKKLYFDPYFIGLIIGDGYLCSQISITTMRDEVRDYIYDYAFSMGWGIRESRKENNKATSYYIRFCQSEGHHYQQCSTAKAELIRLNLYDKTAGDKFIPDDYLYASTEDRMLLLAGLLDTDSYYSEEHNSYEYCTKSHILALQIQQLCRSIGIYCGTPKEKIVNDTSYYRMTINGDSDRIPTKVFIRNGNERRQKKNVLVTGFSVESIGQGDYYGFTLDGNHLYLDWQFFVHHNSGKSVIVAELANRLNNDILVFQPSKEILEQNLAKMKTYTDDCSAYSASVGQKVVSKITFATIGSVKDRVEEFKHFKYVLVDECHLLSGEKGMYLNFLSMLNCKVLGLTATPFRLYGDNVWDPTVDNGKDANGKPLRKGAMRTINSRLIMLQNDPNKFFHRIIYIIQIQELLQRGYLAKLRYFDQRPTGWNDKRIYTNTSGNEFQASSVQWMMEQTDHLKHTISIVRRLLQPKDGKPRHGILVFMQFIEDAEELCANVADSAWISGETTRKNRERILKEFKEGKIKVLANVGVLTTGYDNPQLDTVVMARPTMSLSLFYQCVGRAIRPYPGKDAWIIDTVGNVSRFGEVGNLYLGHSRETNTDEMFGWVYNWQHRQHEWKQLTGVILNPQKTLQC